MNSKAIITLGAPGHVVYIAEGINKHDMRVGALVCEIADHVDHHAEQELEVGTHVHQSHQDINSQVDTGDDKHQGCLGLVKNVRELP